MSRKLITGWTLLTLLLLASVALADGDRESQMSAALAPCASCACTIDPVTTTWGNWGLDYTRTYHAIRVNPSGNEYNGLQLTFFVHKSAAGGVFMVQDSAMFRATSYFSSMFDSELNGTWRHYEWESITAEERTYLASHPVFYLRITEQACDPLDNTLKIEINDLATPSWNNLFVTPGGGTLTIGTRQNGTRSFMTPAATLSVLTSEMIPGWTVKNTYVGDSVDVPIYLQYSNFSHNQGHDVRIAFDNGLTFVSFTPNISMTGLLVTPSANEVHVTASYTTAHGLLEDVLWGTLRLRVDPATAAYNSAYNIRVKNGATFTGCQYVGATSNTESEYASIATVNPAISFRIAEVNVNKNTTGYGLCFDVLTNVPISTNGGGTGLPGLAFTFTEDPDDYTDYNDPINVPYGSGTMWWSESVDGAVITISENANWGKISPDIVASPNWQTVCKLSTNTGSVLGTDDFIFHRGFLAEYAVVKYTDEVFTYQWSGLQLDDGAVTVVEPQPQGGCPALYVWTGDSYTLEDFVLTHSNGKVNPQPASEYLPLSVSPVEVDGQYRLQVKEFEHELTHLDEIELIAVDYQQGATVAISNDGRVLSGAEEFAPIAAVDADGHNILPLVGERDGKILSITGPGSMTLTYRNPYPDESGHTFSLVGKPPDKEARSAPNESGDRVYAEIEDVDGTWHSLGALPPRHYSSLSSVWAVDSRILNLGETFHVRISWQSRYESDFEPLQVDGSPFVEQRVKPVEATHTTLGKVATPLTDEDGDVVTIAPGETVELSFPAPMSTNQKGYSRAFFLKTHGYYEAFKPGGVLPSKYTLDDNFPNPFNPSTTVGFALPAKGAVELVVYNTLGQEVRTLYNGTLEAGHHRVDWNGLDNDGGQVASGVYLYRLKAGSFTETKKMMLLK